jgi:hypothetical protein
LCLSIKDLFLNTFNFSHKEIPDVHEEFCDILSCCPAASEFENAGMFNMLMGIRSVGFSDILSLVFKSISGVFIIKSIIDDIDKLVTSDKLPHFERFKIK